MSMGLDYSARDYGVTKTESSPYCKLRSVDLRAVRWTKGFWADRFRQCCEVTLPHLWNLLSDPNKGHALTNLRIAAGLEKGEFKGTHWHDEWVYKWLEAAASIYAATGDEALNRRMDEVISIIARAQQPDGYIATQITVRGWKRFQNISHHELYVMGHLMTAACLHHRLTGKTKFLDVARKVGDFLHKTFMPRDPALVHFDVNPSYIMGSVELYRATGDRRYLDLANVFIDNRGAQPRPPQSRELYGGTDLNQDRVPLRQETEVVGHAVFFTYLYAGAADAYMETGDRTLLDAIERLRRDLTERKMYVTGGVCPVHSGLSCRWFPPRQVAGGSDTLVGGWTKSADNVHEAAGPEFDLPNATAYNETCGQIGNLMWNWRMLAITGEAQYADVMELNIYNSILSGIGLDGASWFYTNPLRWYGKEHKLLSQDAHQRFQPGLDHICCPSNLVRTIAEWHGCLYSVSDEGLWVNHYGASIFDGTLWDGAPLKVTQETSYPWEGDIYLTLEMPQPKAFGLMLRVPAWAEGARVKVNGKGVRVVAPRRARGDPEHGRRVAEPGTYARLERVWCSGDRISLTLPMKPRLMEAHPKVEAARNHVSVMRGPIVYCLESVDLPQDVRVSEILIPRGVRWTAHFQPELLGGVTVLEGEGRRAPQGDWSGRLYRPLRAGRLQRLRVRLIPYYAWANRGISEMSIWLPLC
jgi:DUF1680 family protein